MDVLEMLRRLPRYRYADDEQLENLAKSAKLLRLSTGRVVRAPPPPPDVCLYLIRGQVRRTHRRGRLEFLTHRSKAARDPILDDEFPQLVTGGRVKLLRIGDPEPALTDPALLQSAEVFAPADEGFEAWLGRFLAGPLLTRLSAVELQRLFRGLTVLNAAAGEVLVRRGERGDSFYVVREGAVQIVQEGRNRHVVRGGGFFGEDALLSGAPRNADVIALTPCTLLRLPMEVFAEVLMTSLQAPPVDLHCERLELAVDFDPRALGARLNPGTACLVSGGSPNDRRYAAFHLRHRGFDVFGES